MTMRLMNWRRTLPGIALVAGLMAMVLSCGGSAEYATGTEYAEEQRAVEAPPPPTAVPASVSNNGPGPQGPDNPAGSAGPQGQPGPREESASLSLRPTLAAMVASAAPTPLPPPSLPGLQSDRDESSARPQNGVAPGQSYDPQSVPSQPQTGRQLIVAAWVSLQVDAIDPVARQVEAVTAQRGGWVESADIIGEGGYRTASINVRVPAARFNETMTALRALGIVTDEGISSEDVTDRLIDNAARMTAWLAQEKRLIVLLENAATVEDIVDIEKRISEVRADIEQVAATQRSLQNRVAASLISVHLHLPRRFAADPPIGQMTLAVGDPAATAAAIAANVAARNGYIGEKREYRQERSDLVEMTAFVKPADLPALMDYAGTLGEITDRRLDSVGPSPANDAPSARLTLAIRSNVNSAATLNLSATDAIAVAGQIRARAESLDGYVESWREVRQEDGDIINLEVVVKASDLRAIMEYGATLGDTENWQYSAVGQSPADGSPNARLTLSVHGADNNPTPSVPPGVIAAVVIAIVVVGAAIVGAAIIVRRRRNRSNYGGVSPRQPLEFDAGGAGAADAGGQRE